MGEQDNVAFIPGYRADPTGKFGGADMLETMPTKFRADQIADIVKTMAAAKDFGVPQLSASDLAALALKEGMGPSGLFGVDPVVLTDPKTKLMTGLKPYDPTMKGDKELFDALRASGASENGAAFAVRLKNKQAVADRLKVPFMAAWNGLGKGERGETGFDYAEAYKDFQNAASHKKNTPLLNAISAAIEQGYKQPIKKASGGVVIDDGNPAKRRKLI